MNVVQCLHPTESQTTENNHNIHSKKRDDPANDQEGTSSEAAGIVRGSLKTTIQTVFRRSSSSRLLRPSHPQILQRSKQAARAEPYPTPIVNPCGKAAWKNASTSSTLSKALAKGGAPKKPVVRASEHLAHDIVKMALGQETEPQGKEQSKNCVPTTNQHGQDKPSSSRSQLFGKIRLVSASLLKNTMLGIAGFETYEHTLDHFHDKSTNHQNHHHHHHHHHGQRKDVNEDTTIDVTCNSNLLFESTPLSQHFWAGMAAGSVHSILQLAIESASSIHSNRFQMQLYPTISSISLYGSFHMLHHAFSHALMFSSYEGAKRMLYSTRFLNCHDDNIEGKKSTPDDDHSHAESFGKNHHVRILSIPRIFAIGLAGGFAGQVHHVTSHIMEFLFSRIQEKRLQQQWHPQQNIPSMHPSQQRHVNALVPSTRSVVLAFLPSALGFIAFEYGKFLVD